MREATEEDGETPKFQVSEWLSEDQIKYLFSRFAAEIKKGPKNKPRVEDLVESLVSPSEAQEEANDEAIFENEAKEAKDDEDENFYVAASEAALLSDIRLQAIENPDVSEHPLMVRVMNMGSFFVFFSLFCLFVFVDTFF